MRNVVCTSDAPNVIGRDARQQTERALQNIAAIPGSNLDKVLRCGVFLKNMNDFDAMNDVYGKIFGPSSPGANDGRGGASAQRQPVQIDAIALE